MGEMYTRQTDRQTDRGTLTSPSDSVLAPDGNPARAILTRHETLSNGDAKACPLPQQLQRSVPLSYDNAGQSSEAFSLRIAPLTENISPNRGPLLRVAMEKK